jgi:hypothetical protein
MNRVKLEQRERIALTEEIQAGILDALHMERVREELGHYAVKMSTLVEDLYVPNVHDGIASVPKDYQESNATPVIVAMPEEEIHLDDTFATTNPLQKEALRIRFRRWQEECDKDAIEGLIEFVDALLILRTIDCDNLVLPEPGFTEIVIDQSIYTDLSPFSEAAFPKIGKDKVKKFIGRPIVGLAIGEYSTAAIEPILVHGLMHVMQFNTRPIWPSEPNAHVNAILECELEAWHVGAQYGALRNYYSDDPRYKDDTLLLQWAVEAIREKYASPSNPFYPNRHIKRALEDEGIDLLAGGS